MGHPIEQQGKNRAPPASVELRLEGSALLTTGPDAEKADRGFDARVARMSVISPRIDQW